MYHFTSVLNNFNKISNNPNWRGWITPVPTRYLQVLLSTMHMALASSLLQHQFPTHPNQVVGSRSDADNDHVTFGNPHDDGFPPQSRRVSGRIQTKSLPLWTLWDKAYVIGAICVFIYAEMIHPMLFGIERLPFLPLMIVSVYGAIGVTVCWIISVVTICRMV